MTFDPHDAAPLYATNALRGRERSSFELHLVHCKRCGADIDWLAETTAALALAIEPVELPPALRERILAAARAEGRQ